MRPHLIAKAALAVAMMAGSYADAFGPLKRARYYNWHDNYAHVQYGTPVAMVVPPTAQLQTTYSWGVSSFALHRLDHQFGRNYPGAGPHGGPFQPQPVWPQSTSQFGVYHVRSVW